jgi:hypothetical protein
VKRTLLALACLVFGAAAQAPPPTLSVTAPVYKSNKKGTSFTPFNSSAPFLVTVRLATGLGQIPVLGTFGEPWLESFTVTAKSVVPSAPASGAISSPIPVKGTIHLTLGSIMPLPSDIASLDLWMTTQVTTLKKGVPHTVYFASPPQPIGVSGATLSQQINPQSVSVGGKLVIDPNGTWVGNPIIGPRGDPGPMGPDGPQGPLGPEGLPGDAGPQGPEGDQGPQGSPGDPGPAGVQGGPGPQGPKGNLGPQGPAGSAGVQGPKGDLGRAGSPGSLGPQGPQGGVGPEGLAGDLGPQGPQGPAGSQGAVGPLGLAGPKGDLGPDGPQGSAGLQGPAGTTGLVGFKGDLGPVGSAGPLGPLGPKGDPGPLGPAGHLGPQGPQGDVGVQGLPGETGPEGQQGILGPQGPAGPDGVLGIDGAMGPKGDFGSQGPQGNAGPQGPQGSSGTQGPQGPQGLPGLVGPNGVPGQPGPQGPLGPKGPHELVVIKILDESVASNSVLQNDNELFFSVGAGETWKFEVWLIVSCGAKQPDIKLAFTAPADASIRWSGIGDGNGGADHELITTSGASDVFAIPGGTTKDSIVVTGLISAGASAGTLHLRWAQNSSNSNPVKVEALSHLRAWKL